MSGLSEAPDYNKQVYSDRPVGVIFEEDPDKKPNYVSVVEATVFVLRLFFYAHVVPSLAGQAR